MVLSKGAPKVAHGGLIRSSLLTFLLPAARLLCDDGERSSDDLYGRPVVRVLQRNARNLPLSPTTRHPADSHTL